MSFPSFMVCLSPYTLFSSFSFPCLVSQPFPPPHPAIPSQFSFFSQPFLLRLRVCFERGLRLVNLEGSRYGNALAWSVCFVVPWTHWWIIASDGTPHMCPLFINWLIELFTLVETSHFWIKYLLVICFLFLSLIRNAFVFLPLSPIWLADTMWGSIAGPRLGVAGILFLWILMQFLVMKFVLLF